MSKFSVLAADYIRYIQYERPKPFSKQSLRSYTYRIKALEKVWGDREVESLKKEDVNTLRGALVEKGCSLRYVHTCLCLVRSFLRYCEEERELTVLNPRHIKLPSSVKRQVVYISPENLRKFTHAIDVEDICGLRLMAYLSALLDTGMRASEAISINRESLNLDTGLCLITGKGDKERMVFFREWSLSWIKKYLERREDDHQALFVSHKEGKGIDRVSYQGIDKSFLRMSRISGVKIRPHDVRRTGATYLRRNGADIHAISKWLGHATVKTTEFYIGTDWEDTRKEINRFQSYGMVEQVKRIEEPVKTWCTNKDWICCLACHSTGRPHLAKGYCDRCYVSIWRKRKKIEQQPLQVKEYLTK